MKKLYLILTLAFVFIFTNTQIHAERIDSIDILHYEITATIRNLSAKTISCSVKLIAVAKFNQTTNITLDLLKLTTTSVQSKSQTLFYTVSDSTVRILLEKNYQAGDTILLTITYQGTPVLDGSWGGFYFNGTYAFNMGVGFTHDPHTFGRCWFPCIDNFTDRATYTFHITTDSGFMAVCNGLQKPKTINADGSITWHWLLSETIPTYLASVAVGKYVLIQYDFYGKQSTYPVILAAEAKDTANLRASFIKLTNALQCFEERFGPYLFDRVGYVAVPFNSGAMEHAGNIAYPISAVDGSSNSETLFAHELSHHWWGNQATCSTAGDMWLNEGWASFCEALFLECVYGKEAYNNDINTKLFTVLRWAHVHDKGYRALADAPTQYTYGTHVYKKGALIVHTLRTVMGDSSFFDACKSYLYKNRFKDVNSLNIRDEFQKFTTYDLTHFFDSWIFDKGHADLQLTSVNTVDENKTILNFNQMSRWKSLLPKTFPMPVNYHLANGNVINKIVNLNAVNGCEFSAEVNTADVKQAAFITINEENLLMPGKTIEKQIIKTTGTKNFNNVLLSITTQQVSDSALIYVEHHFAAPFQTDALSLKNIRVSNERYWHVDGLWPTSFKATAFFNYDGSTPSGNSGYLDNELITVTEDSLVLLYRVNNSGSFKVHTDNTKQSGGSKTDKLGRFWVNNLQKGDYAFGIYDKSASLGSTEKEVRSFKIYPNPGDGLVHVNLLFEHKAGTLEVTDMNGQLIFTDMLSVSINELIIKTASWKAGSYVITFKDEAGKVSTVFIVN
nr:T9SS type A sorting domain-containing protein [Pseudopedobacter sp.]